MVCLGFEPGPQEDGRRRRNHGAIAATKLQNVWATFAGNCVI